MSPMDSDKASVMHIDAVETVHSVNDANEEIVHYLQTTGEEIGMTWRSFMAATSMATCYSAYLFTLLVPPAILSYINAELGPDPRYTWITISWNLGGAILVTLGGRLSDIFGRRYFFIAGACTLIVGSIISATGQNISQMIAGGAIFGAGSGFLEMSFGAVQEVVPSRVRHLTIGMFDVSSIIPQMMPLVSWVIIKNTGNWRICYYIMLGFQVLNLGMLVLFYHPPSFAEKQAEHGKTRRQLLCEFDWMGLFLFVSGCVLFVVAVSWGGSLYPWTSAKTLGPLLTGALTIVVLGFYEKYAPLKEPLFPPRLFRAKRHFTAPMVVMAIAGMSYYSQATLWNRLSQLLYAGDEMSKGLYGEVLPLGTIIGGLIVTVSKYIGHQRWQLLFAIALQTASIGAMSTASIGNPAKSIVLVCIISSTTSVILLNGMVLVGFGIVRQQDIGTAAGLAGTSRLLAGAVATAIFSNVTNNKYSQVLPFKVQDSVESFNLPSSTLTKLIAAAKVNTALAYSSVPGITPSIRVAATLANKEAYLAGAHESFQVALAFGLCGVIAAMFIPSIDTRKYTKRTVAVQQHDRKARQEKRDVRV